MRRLWMLVLLLMLLLGLGGCASDGWVPMTEQQMDSVGNVIEKPIGATRDASIAKESEVHKTLRHRDMQYAKAHKESGFNLEFAMVEVSPGIRAYLPTKIGFRETPRFEQPLPTKPSEHPMWSTIDRALDKGLWAFLGHEFFSFGKSAVKESGDTYQGDYAPYQSHNPGTFTGDGATYQPFAVKPEIVRPEIVYPEVVMPSGE